MVPNNWMQIDIIIGASIGIIIFLILLCHIAYVAYEIVYVNHQIRQARRIREFPQEITRCLSIIEFKMKRIVIHNLVIRKTLTRDSNELKICNYN